MSKGVIYIDTEDDITSIVGKVKGAKERIIALVPPARIGVLQSAVNLRILSRTAEKEDKRLVLITNSSALLPLAANAKIPVAKTLQSKPEIPEIEAIQIDDDVDVIDGSSIPVEDYVKQSQPKEAKKKDAAVASIMAAEKSSSKPSTEGSSRSGRGKKTKPVPEFNRLRNKIFIAVAILLVLIVAAVLMTVFGSKATISLSANTTNESVSTGVTLLTDTSADTDESSIEAIKAEVEKKAEVEFTATGKREEGEHATGTITLSNSNKDSVNVDVGYAFSNGNCTFTATNSVRVPGYSGRRASEVTPGVADVSVKATQHGEECNLSSRTYQVNSDELDPRDITARGGDMTGGSLREVTFVTQADVQRATEDIAENSDDDIVGELKRELGERVFAIEESFAAEASNPVSSPEIGDEAAEGKATLTVSANYVMYGVEEGVIAKFIERAVNQKLPEEESQRVYEVNTDSISFDSFSPQEYGGVAMLVAEAEVGPDVHDDEIKQIAMGKRFGDIQSELQRMQGIDDVEVKFSPFWVNKVPEDEDKIIVKFNIQD